MIRTRKNVAYIVSAVILVLLLVYLVAIGLRPGQGNPSELVTTLLFGHAPNSSAKAVFNGANSQLLTIYSVLQRETRDQFSRGNTNAVESAIIAVEEARRPAGYDYFRLLTGSNHVWIALNPETALWVTPDSHQDDIAAYWPLEVTHPTNALTGFVAICFDGRITFLTNLPHWKPLGFPTNRDKLEMKDSG